MLGFSPTRSGTSTVAPNIVNRCWMDRISQGPNFGLSWTSSTASGLRNSAFFSKNNLPFKNGTRRVKKRPGNLVPPRRFNGGNHAFPQLPPFQPHRTEFKGSFKLYSTLFILLKIGSDCKNGPQKERQQAAWASCLSKCLDAYGKLIWY